MPKIIPTKQEQVLFEALISNNIPVYRQKWDGHKHIDIAIPKYKLNIEVDGPLHSKRLKTACSDLRRTYYSYAKGYVTLRIPNILIDRKLEETIKYILKIIQSRKILN